MRRFYFFPTSIVVIILIPLVLTLAGHKGRVAARENRKLQSELHLEGARLSLWPSKIDSWYQDAISLRSEAIAMYVDLWRKLRADAGVYIRGRDREFFTNFRGSFELESYLGLRPLSHRKLRNIKYSIASTQAYCELKGIPYLCFFVPDKSSLYSEKLPFYVRLGDKNRLFSKGQSWGQQFFSVINGTPLNVINLQPSLEEGKKHNRMYHYRFDPSHWNGYGLSVAYLAMKEKMRSLRPDLIQNQSILPYSYKLSNANNEKKCSIKYSHPERYRVYNDIVARIMPKGVKNKADCSWWVADYVVNTNTKFGRLCFASDSYFRDSILPKLEGSRGQIAPFVDDFHELLHMQYNWLSPESIQEICDNYQPDFFVEEFVEHHPTSLVRKTTPYWATLADLLLQTSSARILTPQETPLASLSFHNASWEKQGDALVFHSAGTESYINTDTPPSSGCRITVNNDRLAVLIARIESPANTEAIWEVKLANDPKVEWTKKVFNIKKGLNHVRIEYEGNPGDVLEWKFTPGQVAGDYIFHDIPEAQQLRKTPIRDSIVPIQ